MIVALGPVQYLPSENFREKGIAARIGDGTESLLMLITSIGKVTQLSCVLSDQVSGRVLVGAPGVRWIGMPGRHNFSDLTNAGICVQRFVISFELFHAVFFT